MPTSKPEIKVAELQHLQNRKSEKWRAFPREILPMPFAVMDFELAEPIKTAITGLIQDSDAGYLGEIPELGENFSAFASSRWGWKVKPREVRVAPDVGVAVIEVARLISKPGDQIIINTPVYYNFFNWIREIHCQAVDIPLIAPTPQAILIASILRGLNLAIEMAHEYISSVIRIIRSARSIQLMTCFNLLILRSVMASRFSLTRSTLH